jgi:hypothetical protein
MKILKNFSLVLLALTVIGTLAFNDAPVKKAMAGTLFVYTPDLIPSVFDPTEYFPDPFFDPADDADCPGDEVVCAIETPEVYPSNYSTPASYANKPMVDVTPTPGNISQRIIDVLADPENEEGVEEDDDIVWLKDDE